MATTPQMYKQSSFSFSLFINWIFGFDAEFLAASQKKKTTSMQQFDGYFFPAPQCAILSPAFKVREFSITDIVPYSISLKWNSAAEEGLR